jgi:hypothetical protein
VSAPKRRTVPVFDCPTCGVASEMVVSPEQAFCTNRETDAAGNDACLTVIFNPWLDYAGLTEGAVELEPIEAEPGKGWTGVARRDIVLSDGKPYDAVAEAEREVLRHLPPAEENE